MPICRSTAASVSGGLLRVAAGRRVGIVKSSSPLPQLQPCVAYSPYDHTTWNQSLRTSSLPSWDHLLPCGLAEPFTGGLILRCGPRRVIPDLRPGSRRCSPTSGEPSTGGLDDQSRCSERPYGRETCMREICGFWYSPFQGNASQVASAF